jgi:pimeloyl-ACP methyl ester carboxylesterase
MSAIQFPFSVGGRLTRVLMAGNGSKVVVFIHGLGARADRWRGTVERAATAGYRCIAFDMPGHGFAAKDNGAPATVPDLAQFLSGLLVGLAIPEVTVVGTSLGGHVAAYFASTEPERVRGLMLVGALGLVPIGREAGLIIRQTVIAPDRARTEAKLRFVLAEQSLITSDLIEEEFRINSSPGSTDCLQRLGDYIATKVDDDCVGPRIAAQFSPEKLLLVWGAEDKAVPVSVGKAAQAVLRNPRLILIPGAGHAPYMEKPDLFDPELLSFLANQWRVG